MYIRQRIISNNSIKTKGTWLFIVRCLWICQYEIKEKPHTPDEWSLWLLHFRRQCNIQVRSGLYIHRRRKQGVSKGEYPLGSGFPIGASSIPIGTRFSAGKSSVLYLCFRLTLERNWIRYLLCRQVAVVRFFSAAVGQADFVRTRTKFRFAHRAKSAWPEKEAEVYISRRPVQRYTYSLPSIGVSNICFASCCNSADVFSSIGSIVPT